MTNPAAGWYDDPNAPGQLRWWDGAAWTDHVSPGTAAAQQPQAATSQPAVAAQSQPPVPSWQPAQPQQYQPAAQAAQYAQQSHAPLVANTGGAAAGGLLGSSSFVVRQWVRPIVNKYEVNTGEGTATVAYVEQKRLRLKEHIVVYADTSKAQTLFEFRANKVLESRATYTITDAQGQQVGTLQKVFGKSLLRSTWKIFDAQGREVAWLREKSMALAIWRRFIGIVPYIGDLLAAIPVPYGFIWYAGEAVRQPGAAEDAQEIGSHIRRIGLRDIYDLNLPGDPNFTVDRRLVVAMGIGLDALQRR